MELISLSVCDLNTNEAGNGGNLRFAPSAHLTTQSSIPSQPSLAIKNHSVYYNMPHTKIHIIETDKDTKSTYYDASSVVVKPTIAQQWAKIGGGLYQPKKPKKNKKIVPNNDNIQTGWWE